MKHDVLQGWTRFVPLKLNSCYVWSHAQRHRIQICCAEAPGWRWSLHLVGVTSGTCFLFVLLPRSSPSLCSLAAGGETVVGFTVKSQLSTCVLVKLQGQLDPVSSWLTACRSVRAIMGVSSAVLQTGRWRASLVQTAHSVKTDHKLISFLTGAWSRCSSSLESLRGPKPRSRNSADLRSGVMGGNICTRSVGLKDTFEVPEQFLPLTRKTKKH